MEINENANALGEVAADMMRFLMHGCSDIGAICDVEGNIQTFDVNDPCFLLAVGDDEFAVVSQAGHHEPQIVVFYIDHGDTERIESALRADATEHNMARVMNDLATVQEVAWEALDEFDPSELPATFADLIGAEEGFVSY